MKAGTSEYVKVHYWAKTTLPKIDHCQVDQTHRKEKLEWANISGKYKKVMADWVYLCKQCHTLLDMKKIPLEKIKDRYIARQKLLLSLTIKDFKKEQAIKNERINQLLNYDFSHR